MAEIRRNPLSQPLIKWWCPNCRMDFYFFCLCPDQNNRTLAYLIDILNDNDNVDWIRCGF